MECIEHECCLKGINGSFLPTNNGDRKIRKIDIVDPVLRCTVLRVGITGKKKTMTDDERLEFAFWES